MCLTWVFNVVKSFVKGHFNYYTNSIIPRFQTNIDSQKKKKLHN